MRLLLVYAAIVMATTSAKPTPAPDQDLSQQCLNSLADFGKDRTRDQLKKACARVAQLPSCASVQGVPIFHYQKEASRLNADRILVFSLIHGDELPAGDVGRYWMERLEDIDPRNTWRVVPILNPDGLKMRTRTNANKVDLNRNFPTKDWEREAIKNWKREKQKARRFPGESAASEPETRCALKHIETFEPNFVVSIHTPLRVLDFDGPPVTPPKFDYLPWRSLGHFPGSLGRYLWFERKIPVLTAELKDVVPPMNSLVQLQDVIGFLVAKELGPPRTQKNSRESSSISKTEE